MCLRFAPAQEVHTISTVKKDNMIELESEVGVQTSSSMKSGHIFLKYGITESHVVEGWE
jgi:hypothetical protein